MNEMKLPPYPLLRCDRCKAIFSDHAIHICADLNKPTLTLQSETNMAIDEHGYPCSPRKIDDLSWFYEQHTGIIIVNQPIEGARSTTIKIPWRKMERAVDNHRAIRAALKPRK